MKILFSSKDEMIAKLVNEASIKEGVQYTITIEEDEPEMQPIKRGNRADLHVYLAGLAVALNDKGCDQRKVTSLMKPSLTIPWTGAAVKEILWRPIQKVVAGVDSSESVGSQDMQNVCCSLTGWLEDKGLPTQQWPSKHPSTILGDTSTILGDKR